MDEEEKRTEVAADETEIEETDRREEELQKEFAQGSAGTGEPSAGPEDESWRMQRDAAALTREKMQEKEEAESTATAALAEDTGLRLSRRKLRREEKEAAAAQKAAAKEAAAAQKAAAEEEAARRRQEALEEKESQKRLEAEERERKRHEKQEAKSAVRQERGKEVKSLWHTAELVMLLVFILLAVDQAGLYGFLFVWLFVAVMAASVVLLLLGVVRAVRKKRCGIIFFAAIAGIILCTAWFIFLVSSQGLGIGPIMY